MGIIETEISDLVMSAQPETRRQNLEYNFKVSFLISGSQKMNEGQQHINEFHIEIHKSVNISFSCWNLG